MTLDGIRAELRRRLDGKRAPDPGATIPDGLEPVSEGVPAWWSERGNVMLARPGETRVPGLIWFPGVIPARGAIVVLGGAVPPRDLLLFSDSPLVVLGRDSSLSGAELCCGDEATLVVGDDVVTVGGARIDSRHGGLVSIGRDGLWAGEVRVLSDDMHPIRDREGRRLNAYGGTVIVEEHVWLGLEAIVLSGAHVGAGSVVGARSLVKGRLPANAVCVGSPARAIRHDISWDKEDAP